MPAGWGIGAIVDVETTGLSCLYHEIVELALLLFAFDRATGDVMGIVDEYSSLREPGRSIPADVIAIHGITPEMVRGKSLVDGRVEAMLDRAEFVIAHNASFDYGFVTRLYPSAAGKRWLCSCHGIDWLAKGLPNRKLDTLIQAYGICDQEVHRAADDAMATLALLAVRGPSGLSHFAELAQRHGLLATAASEAAATGGRQG
ncbi:MAG: exonuclease domain-containing protein [Chloroflexota bacterium]|jgi:DNA polymerase-3 subunit epsilon